MADATLLHDAEFIVWACNAHEGLLAAAELALEFIEDQARAGLDMTTELQRLTDAIAKAKEQPSAESN